MQKYLQPIRDLNGKVTPELLDEIISSHRDQRDKMIKLYERYKASEKGVPVLTRSLIDYEDFGHGTMKRIDNKVNNKLNNPFDADVVDTKIGYFLGHPITYEYDDNEEGSKSKVKDEIDDFNLRNHVEDEDSELGKMATICGYGARLAYIEKDTGYERIKNIDPWKVIFIGEEVHEPEFSIRYYEGYDNKKYAEFYNEKDIIFFTADNGKYVEDNSMPHLFDCNPLYGLANNKELQGDTEKVLALIDAYDRTLSDASNEIEQYRLAYLVLKGMVADDNLDMRHKKVIELLGEHDDVSYLTKDINDALIEHHLDRLEKNILRFAKSVDFTDEQFGGNITGEALKQKLRALENKCITMERKFTAMLRYQFKVIFSSWKVKEKVESVDKYLKVWFAFKRNNPVNLVDESMASKNLKGIVSEKTRLSALSIVDDVEYELEEMKKEQDEYFMNLPSLTDPSNPQQQVNQGQSASTGASGNKDKTCPTCGGSGKVTSEATGSQIQCQACGGDGVISG